MMVRIARLRWIRRVPIGRCIVLRPLSVANHRTVLPLPALLLNRHLWVDAPIEAFALLVAFDESIVLSEIVPDAGLPTTSCSFELVPGILLLDVSVDLL